MGPRETRFVEERWKHQPTLEKNHALQAARLADALEEALAFWDDAGISEANAGHYDRLRAVLAEVDRG